MLSFDCCCVALIPDIRTDCNRGTDDGFLAGEVRKAELSDSWTVSLEFFLEPQVEPAALQIALREIESAARSGETRLGVE